MQLKAKPEYVDIDAPFTPLPKQGHLSKKHPAYAAAESAIRDAYAHIWSCPDWPAVRALAGDADAVMPPGGPDRNQDIVTELLYFSAPDGHKIELKLYKSRLAKPGAVLMYRMHGGGAVLGRHEADGVENVYAAVNSNIIVVSVDYRKAPEYPFPQAIHDSYDGFAWCRENAKSLGIDPEKIIVGGSSAGAMLAAGLALEARDNNVTGIIAQILHFPPICHAKFFPRDKYEYGSYIQNANDGVLSTVLMELFMDSYTPNVQPNQLHSPLLANSLRGLPPALIQCAGVDILRDDAFAYAEALETAGVEVEFHAYPGLPHCFPIILTGLPETEEFYRRFNAYLQKCVAGKTSS